MAKASTEVWSAVTELLDGLPSADARQDVAVELLSLATALSHEPRLRAALADPSLEDAQKSGLVRAVFGSQVSAAATDVLAVVAGQRLKGHELVEVTEEVGAQTLMDVADALETLDDVEDQLFGFAHLVDRDHELRAALTDPALPADRKRAVVDRLLAGRTDPRAKVLLEHWVDIDQAGHLPRLVDETIAAAAARRDRVVGTVTTAVPLDGDQRRRLEETFGRLVGKPVDLQVEVDPLVVGSLSVRIGDEVYDGTVKRQLERARERIGAL